jgi:NAD(P)-dependent dehydrogenase (short-subunit alcohol dehydrogenase family)
MIPSPAALVTGGAAGIGAAIVRALVAAGHAVTFCDRERIEGDRLSAETGATFVHLDVLDESARARLFAEG